MRWKIITAISILISLAAAHTLADVARLKQEGAERTFKVHLIYEDAKGVVGVTGTAWKSHGRYLVTNKHVALACAGHTPCLRRLTDNSGNKYEFNVIGVSSNSDVAVLEATTDIPGSEPDFAAEPPVIGEEVYSIGYPKGKFRVSDSCQFKGTFFFSIRDLDPVYMTDCYAVGGASGSALYNAQGQIIALVYASGVDISTGERLANVQYSIPLYAVKREVASIIEKGSVIQGMRDYEYQGLQQHIRRSL